MWLCQCKPISEILGNSEIIMEPHSTENSVSSNYYNYIIAIVKNPNPV